MEEIQDDWYCTLQMLLLNMLGKVYDFNLGIEERQVELPHLFGVWEDLNAESCNCANKRNGKDNS